MDDEQGNAIWYRLHEDREVEPEPHGYVSVSVNVKCDYVRHLVLHAFQTHPIGFDISHAIQDPQQNIHLQWDEYENLDWSRVLKGQLIANSYCIRKGLSRKAQLSIYLDKYIRKHPSCSLKGALPETLVIETWDAFNNDLGGFHVPFSQRISACLWEVKQRLEEEKSLWILKPSATNKGAEVHVVESYEKVRQVVLEWTDIREWVLQRYIERPLLLNERKFHIRTYVAAIGSLKVHVFQPMLVLTAMDPYEQDTALSHITNTAYQAEHAEDFKETECVYLLSELGTSQVETITEQINQLVAQIFDAYRGEFAVFQPLPNCFELFGLDFLVDQDLRVSFLEVNPGPDFKQTGSKCQPVIDGLMHDTVELVSAEFFNAPARSTQFKQVYDEKWGYQSKSNASSIKLL